jgi:hypothetical protein
MIVMVLLSLAVFALIGGCCVGWCPCSPRSSTPGAAANGGTARPSRFPDLLRPMLAVWTVLVLVFLFIPILLVVRHSFNNGPSFSIWSGSYSTVWWGGPPGRPSRA